MKVGKKECWYDYSWWRMYWDSKSGYLCEGEKKYSVESSYVGAKNEMGL